MRIARLNKQNSAKIISETLKILRQGGLVVFPTDTVYGLLVDATQKQAVEKLIAFKTRPAGRAISIFVANLATMKQYVHLTKAQVQRLKSLLPGPYTIVLPSRGKTNALLEAENHTLGVRVPDYPRVTKLVQRFKGAVTATSANLSGKPPVHSVFALLNQLSQKKKDMIDLIVDAGQLPRNKPSTVVDFTQDSLKILRQGDKNLGQQYVSRNEDETKEIAKKVLTSFLSKKPSKPLVFILQGDLGAGKTIFVKGIGEYLGVRNIISPTFVIYYEYPTVYQYINALIHFDLYKVQDASEFKHLGVEKYLKKGNILAFEWGEKSGEISDILRQKAIVIYMHIEYKSQGERIITVTE